MVIRPVDVLLGSVATSVAAAVIATAIELSAGASPAPPPPTVTVPRPVFPLDTAAFVGSRVDSTGDADAGVETLAAAASRHFGVPPPLLELLLERDVKRENGAIVLAPLDTRVCDELLGPEHGDGAPTSELQEFLGRDPRPLNARLVARPQLGIPLRAALLRAQERAYAVHLRSLGLSPEPGTTWLLATLSVLRGDPEVLACIEEGLDDGDHGPDRNFVDVAPTFRLLEDGPLVLQAFQRNWKEAEAEERARAFRAAVADAREAFTGGNASKRSPSEPLSVPG